MIDPNTSPFPKSSLAQAKWCLALVRDIAARGALSDNPEHVGYALQELSQVLLERTGTEELYFEPVPATELKGLEALYEELNFVNDSAEDMARTGWN